MKEIIYTGNNRVMESIYSGNLIIRNYGDASVNRNQLLRNQASMVDDECFVKLCQAIQ